MNVFISCGCHKKTTKYCKQIRSIQKRNLEIKSYGNLSAQHVARKVIICWSALCLTLGYAYMLI